MRVWDVMSGDLLYTMMGGRYGFPVQSVSSSADGTRIVSGGSDGRVLFWDAASGKQLHAQHAQHAQHAIDDSIKFVSSVSMSGNGTRVASGGYDGRVVVWDAESGSQLIEMEDRHDGPVYSVSMSSNGQRVASVGLKKLDEGDEPTYFVCVWNASNGVLLHLLDRGHDYRKQISCVSMSSDGTRVASGAGDGRVVVWDAVKGEKLHTMNHGSDHDWVDSVSMSGDGKRVASGGKDGRVVVWNAVTGEKLRTMNHGSVLVHRVSMSSDGRRVASGGEDGRVMVWDTESGTQLKTMGGHGNNWVTSVSMLGDGTRVASSSSDFH